MIEYYDLIERPHSYPNFNEDELLNYEYDTYTEAENSVDSGFYYGTKDDGDLIDVYIVLVQCDDNGDVTSITEAGNISYTKSTEPSDYEQHNTMNFAGQGV